MSHGQALLPADMLKAACLSRAWKAALKGWHSQAPDLPKFQDA
jgi:hypothetical protein